MPYYTSWSPPDLVIDLGDGECVYHAYKDQDFDHRLEYWYTTDPDEDSRFEFDVRELSCYDPTLTHKAMIEEAHKRGELKFPG